MNRTDMIRQVLALEGIEAAAKRRSQQVRATLEEDARREYEQDGTAPTWRVPDIATVVLPLSKQQVIVADAAVFTKWVATRYPTEVEQTTTVRPAFQAALFSRVQVDTHSYDYDLDAREWSHPKPVFDTDGEIVPGLTVRPAGVPLSLLMRPNSDAKAAYLAAGDALVNQMLPLTGFVEIPADGAQ